MKNVGDFLYFVYVSREKPKEFSFVDDKGVKWYRYGRGGAAMKIIWSKPEKHLIVTVIRRKFEGRVPDDKMLDNISKNWDQDEFVYSQGDHYIVKVGNEYRFVEPSKIDDYKTEYNGSFYFSSEDKMNDAILQIERLNGEVV